jgi:glycosyltransferase involved in cell wall biosynthesis
MPVLEAMATGVPVAATWFTAVPEHLYEDPIKRKGQRGFPIEVEYVTNDPFGNSFRAFPGRASGVEALSTILKWRGKKLDEITARARAYAESRTLDLMGSTLDGIVRAVSVAHLPAAPAGSGVTPMTVPHLIPLKAKEDV